MTRVLEVSGAIRPASFCYAYMRYVSGPGAPADDRDMNINGAVTPAVYEFPVPSGKDLALVRINFVIVDASIQYSSFGAATLTNGLLIKFLDADDTVLLDPNEGEVILTVIDMAALAGSDALAEPAAGPDAQPVRWTIERAGAKMLLRSGDKVQITVQDDMSGLDVFRCMVQGIYSSARY